MNYVFLAEISNGEGEIGKLCTRQGRKAMRDGQQPFGDSLASSKDSGSLSLEDKLSVHVCLSAILKTKCMLSLCQPAHHHKTDTP